MGLGLEFGYETHTRSETHETSTTGIEIKIALLCFLKHIKSVWEILFVKKNWFTVTVS